MDAEIFKKFIQNTPLLEDKEKTYYLSRASVYSDAIKEEMISIIRSHETNLLKAIQTKKIEDKKALSKQLDEKLLAIEKLHETEILEAESLLEKELSEIS